jgi:apolipoprotein D and lipocalin family protein
VTIDSISRRGKDMRLLSLLVLLLLGHGCAGIPQGVEPVEDFEVSRYLGQWYEIARLENRFEEGLTNVTAQYGLRDDGGIDVINRGYDSRTRSWKEARGRGYFMGSPDVGSLKVTFFWPFYSGYTILKLERESYRYALVCGSSREYLWILAREPSLDEAVLAKLMDFAQKRDFAVHELIFPGHDAPGP